MAFWNTTDVEPKRQFKFKVTFSLLNAGAGAGSEGVFLAQSADRPMYTISDTTKVDFLDKSFHFPGKITWNQVKIKFVDAVAQGGALNVAKKSYDYLTDAGYINPQQMNTTGALLGTVGKGRAVTALTNVSIQVLDSAGTPVDTWTLNNAWITNVNLNNLDYAGEAILTAEYTLRYDWATYG